ncbi:MAG TPA: hypothetical protein VLF67_01055, partial [Candidatus Saccharimonas sp.]|nr:hypothetical protein [Candidatus Saccharimonas sp.]
GTEAQAWIIAVAAAAGVGVLWAYLQHPHEALSATDFATAFILTISAVRYIALPAFMEAVGRKAK